MITSKPRVLWTLPEALVLIRELQPLVRELNYHLCLGGGVLNTGESEKDLDLFFLPLNGHPSRSQGIVTLLNGLLGPGRSIRDSPDYLGDAEWHLVELLKFSYLGKRIDAFIQ